MAQPPLSFVTERIRRMRGYVPGLQINDPQIVKLNTNENAFALPGPVMDAIEKELHRNRLHLYPGPESSPLRERLGAMYGLGPESVLIGNGSDEILRLVFQLFLNEGDSVAVLDPSYSLYPILAEMFGATLHRVPLRSDWTADFQALARSSAKLAIVTNPNAPTGIEADNEDVLSFEAGWGRPVLVDEAYAVFGSGGVMREAGRRPLLLACNTFSKAFSLAGMRIGWLVAHPDLIREFDKIRDSYNLSVLAQVCGMAALDHLDLLEENTRQICSIRDQFSAELKRMGFEVLPSKTNFVFVSPPSRSGKALYDYLLKNHILARHFKGERLDPFLRISIGTHEAMLRVLEILQKGLSAGDY